MAKRTKSKPKVTIHHTIDDVRDMVKDILGAPTEDGMTKLQEIMVRMADSDDFQKLKFILQIAYGRLEEPLQIEAVHQTYEIVQYETPLPTPHAGMDTIEGTRTRVIRDTRKRSLEGDTDEAA
jgi:hypothetical protein